MADSLHTDPRIMAIADALVEHRDSWTTTTKDGVVFDTELAAVIAVVAIENEYERDDARICRHACHESERDEIVNVIREWADENDQRVRMEELVAYIVDTEQ